MLTTHLIHLCLGSGCPIGGNKPGERPGTRAAGPAVLTLEQHRNPLEAASKQTAGSSPARLIQQASNGVREFSFLTRSQMSLLPLVQGPSCEKYSSSPPSSFCGKRNRPREGERLIQITL